MPWKKLLAWATSQIDDTLRHGAEVSVAGPRFYLRLGLRAAVPEPGHPGEVNRPAIALAKSLRRECLDRVIVFHERQRKKILESDCEYCHEVRLHRSLAHDSPIPLPVESSERGKVIELLRIGGRHRYYSRQAA
jgi:hypothetical protein